jgi:hypothetical protein
VLSVPQPVEAPTLETRFAEHVDQLPVLTRLAVLWATILLMLGFATFAIVAGTAAFQRSAEQRMQELMQAQPPPQGASGTQIPPEFEALRQGRRPQRGGK